MSEHTTCHCVLSCLCNSCCHCCIPLNNFPCIKKYQPNSNIIHTAVTAYCIFSSIIFMITGIIVNKYWPSDKHDGYEYFFPVAIWIPLGCNIIMIVTSSMFETCLSSHVESLLITFVTQLPIHIIVIGYGLLINKNLEDYVYNKTLYVFFLIILVNHCVIQFMLTLTLVITGIAYCRDWLNRQNLMKIYTSNELAKNNLSKN